MEVVLVKKAGPVRVMQFRSWWVYFILLALLVTILGVGGGSYLLHRQQRALMELAEDTHLAMLRLERLESLLQEQENWISGQQEAEARATLPPAAPEKKPAAKPEAASAPKAADNAARQAGSEAADSDPKLADPAGKGAAARPNHRLGLLAVRDIEARAQSGELVVRFRLTNERSPSDKAMGYVTVVARGERAGKPWIEASPPMRLTPLGRPLNFRRGTPFSVQYHRSVKATFPIDDKKLQRVEIVIHSREGELILAQGVEVASGPAKRGE